MHFTCKSPTAKLKSTKNNKRELCATMINTNNRFSNLENTPIEKQQQNYKFRSV